MIDKASEILQLYGEGGADPRLRRIAEAIPNDIAEDNFDEQAYLGRYPDIADRIARGEFASGYAHYHAYGRFEGREIDTLVEEAFVLSDRLRRPQAEEKPRAAQACDRLLISHNGGVLLIGWADDLTSPLQRVDIFGDGWRLKFDAESLLRSRREDVEQALATATPGLYGLTGVHFVNRPMARPASCRIVLTYRNGVSAEIAAEPGYVSDADLRDTILTHLANLKFAGNASVEIVNGLDKGAGLQIVALNRSVTTGIVANPYIQRFGPKGAKKKGSIVVCLYGKSEFIFLQNALFSLGRGIEDYEFIYVSNSPELSEPLVRDADICASTYGLNQTLVLLSGNAGFGAANNAAVKAALSDRILNVNPDVFPRDVEWAAKHTDLVANADPRRVKLFGVPLYYDDGSLMHGGMYFELDTGVALRGGRVERQQLVRVEHYGKGAPVWATQFTRARRVPAVTGAFMSSDRAWYEKLGGFSEDYVYGHYEDADLCLKSFASGAPVWLHDLKLWHLEGHGSVRRPVHVGGATVNRWLFLSQWSAMLADGLCGAEPSNPAFSGDPDVDVAPRPLPQPLSAKRRVDPPPKPAAAPPPAPAAERAPAAPRPAEVAARPPAAAAPALKGSAPPPKAAAPAAFKKKR